MNAPKLSYKRLVKALMDNSKIEEIVIMRKKNIVICDVTHSFTPADARDLCRSIGHEDDAKAVSRNGHNYLVFPLQ